MITGSAECHVNISALMQPAYTGGI